MDRRSHIPNGGSFETARSTLGALLLHQNRAARSRGGPMVRIPFAPPRSLQTPGFPEAGHALQGATADCNWRRLQAGAPLQPWASSADYATGARPNAGALGRLARLNGAVFCENHRLGG